MTKTYLFEGDFAGDAKPETISYDESVARFPEIWGYFDPDQLSADWRPPPEMQRDLEDVFGEVARAGGIKLALHPFWKRVSIFEWCNLGEGIGWVWKCFWTQGLAGEIPHENFVASDHKREIHGSGICGEFRNPTRRDFELVRKLSDKQYLSDEARRALYRQSTVDRQAASDYEARQMEDQIARDDYDSQYRVQVNLNTSKGNREDLKGEEVFKSAVFEHRGFKIRVPLGSAAEMAYLSELAEMRGLHSGPVSPEVAQTLRDRLRVEIETRANE